MDSILSRPFKYNDQQEQCCKDIIEFILGAKLADFSQRMLVNGSAGTGKTSIIIQTVLDILLSAIIKMVPSIWDNTQINELPQFIIAAPTNKAKDVLTEKFLASIRRIYDIKWADNPSIPKEFYFLILHPHTDKENR